MLKKIKLIISILALFFFVFIFIVAKINSLKKNSSKQKKETISNFETKIIVNNDGRLFIYEKIVFNLPMEKNDRFFYTIHYDYSANNRTYELEPMNFYVFDEKGYPYQLSLLKDLEEHNYLLRVSNISPYSHQRQVINIIYEIVGGIRYLKERDEFSWEINGSYFSQPIEKASIEVYLPPEAKNKIKASCLIRNYFKESHHCLINTFSNKVYLKPLKNLNHGNFVVTVSFPKNIVAFSPGKEKVGIENTLIGKLVIFLLILFLVFWSVFYPLELAILWWKYGRDPKPNLGLVEAWFSPPKINGRPLRPIEVGALIDENIDAQDIYATFIDLAIRGYLKIEERERIEPTTGKKVREILLKKTDKSWGDDLLDFEKVLLSGFFKKTNCVMLTPLAKKYKIKKYIQEMKNIVYSRLVNDGLFERNPSQIKKEFYEAMIFVSRFLNPFAFFAALIFGMNLCRKTQKGVDLAMQAKAFKKFLTSQKKYLEFQAKNPQFFEKLLPYAIVFKIENLWIKKFKKYLKEINIESQQLNLYNLLLK